MFIFWFRRCFYRLCRIICLFDLLQWSLFSKIFLEFTTTINYHNTTHMRRIIMCSVTLMCKDNNTNNRIVNIYCWIWFLTMFEKKHCCVWIYRTLKSVMKNHDPGNFWILDHHDHVMHYYLQIYNFIITQTTTTQTNICSFCQLFPSLKSILNAITI